MLDLTHANDESKFYEAIDGYLKQSNELKYHRLPYRKQRVFLKDFVPNMLKNTLEMLSIIKKPNESDLDAVLRLRNIPMVQLALIANMQVESLLAYEYDRGVF